MGAYASKVTPLTRQERCEQTKARNIRRKAKRQEQADKRNFAYFKLSPNERIAMLDKRLGKGVGARRQRERLTAQ